MAMKKKLISLALAATMLGTMVVGCTKPAEEGAGGEEGKNAIKVGMVTDVGGINDQSFNQSAWEGLKRAKDELGIEIGYQESKQDADYPPNIENLVDQENDLVWGIGFKMGDAVKEAAENYPDQKFAIIDYSYGDKTPKNIVGVTFKEQEASYLVGLIAGKMTKSNKIGFIGGMEVPVIKRFEYGFRAGVKEANPNAEVLIQYANSFTDSAKGKAIAKQMYSQGADIIFHAAGDTGTGMIEAAKEEGKYAIGVDRDQNSLAPDNVITSAMKRVDNAIYDVTKKLTEGKFEGGTTITYGLAEGGVDIAPTSDKHVPEDVLNLVKEYKNKIIGGEIKVPATEEEFNAMK
ncbi:BMP family lipoprotein [Tepidibacter formicigenes]|jgi:basic membrane protein A|uniref:Basic membrane protein A n=1 Tax=Tepidibacter formicigenes DSM 15518 TaxID=1123349 RepID=A0A1M6KN52_9FIRM|nr:BMP family ABC transporter substrate-binding protein [Tepidibacter formicigenes]SHJ60355.1 basic membrane protein A [Tepidibacter formicigenes DSM 15518]